jgi:hypothetical protein
MVEPVEITIPKTDIYGKRYVLSTDMEIPYISHFFIYPKKEVGNESKSFHEVGWRGGGCGGFSGGDGGVY